MNKVIIIRILANDLEIVDSLTIASALDIRVHGLAMQWYCAKLGRVPIVPLVRFVNGVPHAINSVPYIKAAKKVLFPSPVVVCRIENPDAIPSSILPFVLRLEELENEITMNEAGTHVFGFLDVAINNTTRIRQLDVLLEDYHPSCFESHESGTIVTCRMTQYCEGDKRLSALIECIQLLPARIPELLSWNGIYIK